MKGDSYTYAQGPLTAVLVEGALTSRVTLARDGRPIKTKRLLVLHRHVGWKAWTYAAGLIAEHYAAHAYKGVPPATVHYPHRFTGLGSSHEDLARLDACRRLTERPRRLTPHGRRVY